MDSKTKFWVDTYNRNIKKLIGVCYRYVYDKKVAEDIVHDSFIIAMEKHSAFKGTGHFDAWLRKITINKTLQYLRGVKTTQADQLEVLTQEFNNNEEMFKKYDFTTQELIEKINKLPEHHRQVFNLYVLDGFSHKQISEKLNISVGTSKSHLARAKKKLQKILNEKEETRKYFILPFLPCGFRKKERLYKKSLKNYKISPQNKNFLNSIDWYKVKLPNFKIHIGIVKGILLIGTILAIIVLIVYNSYRQNDLKSNIHNSETIDSIKLQNDSIQIKGTTNPLINDTVGYTIQTKPIDKPSPIVVKKKRIINKKVIVRDTLTVIKKTNVE